MIYTLRSKKGRLNTPPCVFATTPNNAQDGRWVGGDAVETPSDDGVAGEKQGSGEGGGNSRHIKSDRGRESGLAGDAHRGPVCGVNDLIFPLYQKLFRR